MSAPLFLNSLEIHQFRAFEHLRIERLGRVNLVVGKNNVGKTSLLEALLLYAYQGSPSILWKILEARDEGHRPRLSNAKRSKDIAPLLKHLFYGRGEIGREAKLVDIGPVSSKTRNLSLSFSWYLFQTGEDGSRRLQPISSEEYETASNPVLGLKVQRGGRSVIHSVERRPSLLEDPENDNCVFVAANGVSPTEVGQYWDRISLTDLEEDVLGALRIISPEVERVSLVSSHYSVDERERTAIVKTKATDEPIPLRSLGEGMNRLFGMALALVNSKNGILLVDEIESGLHYSVQPNVWRLVFEVARRLNIQVFATTHSWDCITAFQHAAQEYEQDEGVLIRLTEKKGRIVADSFDENELEIAAREEIEVR